MAGWLLIIFLGRTHINLSIILDFRRGLIKSFRTPSYIMWDLQYVDDDFTFDDANRLAIVDGTDRIKQDLVHALMCVQGSDQLNPDFGIDWRKIKGLPFNHTLIEYELRRVLSAHDDVDSIGTIIISSPDATRHIDIEVLITLVSGETVQVEVSV